MRATFASTIDDLSKELDIPGITKSFLEYHKDTLCIQTSVTMEELVSSPSYSTILSDVLHKHKNEINKKVYASLDTMISNQPGGLLYYSGQPPEFAYAKDMGSVASAAGAFDQMNSYHQQVQQQQQGRLQQQAALSYQQVQEFLNSRKTMPIIKDKPKETTMFGEFKNDMKKMFTDHKGVIYSIIGLYLVDHFLLEGKLKAKLLELSHRILGSVEKKIDAIGAASDAKQ